MLKLLTLLNKDGWIKQFHDIATVTAGSQQAPHVLLKIEEQAILFIRGVGADVHMLLLTWQGVEQLIMTLQEKAKELNVPVETVLTHIVEGAWQPTPRRTVQEATPTAEPMNAPDGNGAPTAHGQEVRRIQDGEHHG